MSEKDVQSYQPYERGMYGKEKSDSAIRSGNYRKRNKKVFESQVVNKCNSDAKKKESGEIGTVIDLDSYRNKNECAFGETKAEHTGKQPDKSVEGIQEAVLNLDVLKLKLELVNRFGTSESMETIRKYGKAKNGIIREVLVREG